jgi:hypothetical protein
MMSSISRILGLFYLTSSSRSPKIVKEAIMTDINDLVQEFWRTSSDGAVGATFFAMGRLLKILQECFNISEVFLILFPLLRLPSTWLIKNYRTSGSITGTILPSRTLRKLNSEPNLR